MENGLVRIDAYLSTVYWRIFLCTYTAAYYSIAPTYSIRVRPWIQVKFLNGSITKWVCVALLFIGHLLMFVHHHFAQLQFLDLALQ